MGILVVNVSTIFLNSKSRAFISHPSQLPTSIYREQSHLDGSQAF